MPKSIYLLLLLVASAFATAHDDSDRWIEVRSPRFIIVTSSGISQGRRIAAQFERIRSIFHQSYPEIENDPELPVLILAVKRKDQFRRLAPNTYSSKRSLPTHGLFVRASDKNYILMRLDPEAGNPYPLVFHEYTHVFLRETYDRMPLWLNEGLAEFYQNTEIYDQDVLLGEPNLRHLKFLRENKLLPLETLFTVDEKSPYYVDKKKGLIFHAECWALAHYLMLKDYGEKTSRMLEYTNLVNDDVDAVTAAVRVFGDLRKLQRNLELYIEQNGFNHFTTKFSTKLEGSQFEVNPLSPVQARRVQADYLAASGRPEEARLLLGAAPTDDVSTSETTAKDHSAESAQTASALRSEINHDIPCPLPEILRRASEHATEMVDNLQRFTANEDIEHTEFRKNGKPRKASNQSFSYVAEIDQGPAGSFWVEEYRLAKTQGDSPPLSDTGTAAFALIFHPEKIGNFEFHCEARADLHGLPAWQLRFEESPDPTKSFHQIRIDRSEYHLRLKGHAWIAMEGYEILRLQTDLVAPIPEIHLHMEHLDIAYAPVDFDKPKFRLWLPERTSLEISYRGHRYRRIHRFSRFQLFLVVTEETVKQPNPGPGE